MQQQPISLDDAELEALMSLARPLRPDQRSPFLEAVVAEASKHVVVGPGLVSRIARERQRSFLLTNPIPTHGPGGRLGHRVQR
jgi:hypothetical protein